MIDWEDLAKQARVQVRREEPFVDPRPDGPFIDRPGAEAVKQQDRYLLELLALSTKTALGQARAASALFESCRPIALGANSAALAVAALERLHEELQGIEVAYGLELTNQAKREITF